MNFVKVESGLVIQKQPYLEEGFIEAPDVVTCGWLYDGETFIAPSTPPAPVPSRCSWRQGQKALLRAGKLDAARAFIDSIEDPFDRQDAEIEFGSPTYERASPFLQSVWAALGGTSDELDDLFLLAVTL